MDRIGVESWLKSYEIENYTINEDLSVDVEGNVDLILNSLKVLPIQFRKVSGNFDCYNNKLTSLLGCPVSVGGNFYCGANEICESELFLYSYTALQVYQYYESKNLTEKLIYCYDNQNYP